jgi:hypothetical protein
MHSYSKSPQESLAGSHGGEADSSAFHLYYTPECCVLQDGFSGKFQFSSDPADRPSQIYNCQLRMRTIRDVQTMFTK